jgi:hypothetical protein
LLAWRLSRLRSHAASASSGSIRPFVIGILPAFTALLTAVWETPRFKAYWRIESSFGGMGAGILYIPEPFICRPSK